MKINLNYIYTYILVTVNKGRSKNFYQDKYEMIMQEWTSRRDRDFAVYDMATPANRK